MKKDICKCKFKEYGFYVCMHGYMILNSPPLLKKQLMSTKPIKNVPIKKICPACGHKSL